MCVRCLWGVKRMTLTLCGLIVLLAACSAANADTFQCPITTPNGFIPSSVPDPRLDQFVWHGSDDLFVPFNVDGSYFGRKTVLWSVHFPGDPFEERPAATVTWTRLDVSAEPVSNDGEATNANTAEDGWFIIAGIDPDEPGCWQVEAEYKGAVLTYVYEVDGPPVDASSPN